MVRPRDFRWVRKVERASELLGMDRSTLRTHLKNLAGFLDRIMNLKSFRQIPSERLLAINMLAGVQRVHADASVHRVMRRDDDRDKWRGRDHRTILGAVRILYVVDEFPSVSETFVLGEVRELLRRGDDVRVLSRRRPENSRPPQGSEEARYSPRYVLGAALSAPRVVDRGLARALQLEQAGASALTGWASVCAFEGVAGLPAVAATKDLLV